MHAARLAVLATLLLAAPVAAQSSDGPTLYKRCAACHLPTGAGIPGSFPPLDAHLASFATSSDGRAYLAMVTSKGLSGEIKVGGKSYRGVMPAQNLKPADTAAVLNHVLTRFAAAALPKGWKPFTEAEITQARTVHATASAEDLRRLRGKVLGDR